MFLQPSILGQAFDPSAPAPLGKKETTQRRFKYSAVIDSRHHEQKQSCPISIEVTCFSQLIISTSYRIKFYVCVYHDFDNIFYMLLIKVYYLLF